VSRRRTGLSTTIKYLRRATSGAEGDGLGITVKYLRRTTGGAVDNGLGRPSTCAALRASAWAHRLRSCDAHRAPSRAAASAPRSSTSAAPLESAWAKRSITCDAQPENTQAAARGAAMLPQQEKINLADVQRRRVKFTGFICTVSR
jgi:hypothetical protein